MGFISEPNAGITAFTGLSDTPANYAGSANLWLQVNSGGGAIEFDYVDYLRSSSDAYVYFDTDSSGGDEFYIQSGTPTKWFRMDTTGAIGIGSNISPSSFRTILTQRSETISILTSRGNTFNSAFAGTFEYVLDNNLTESSFSNAVLGILTYSGTGDYTNNRNLPEASSLYGETTFTTSGVGNRVIGISGTIVNKTGGGTITEANVVEGWLSIANSGTITTGSSFYANLSNSSSTLTTYNAFNADGADSGQPVTYTGMRINCDGSTNNYAFEFAGSERITSGTFTGQTEFIRIKTASGDRYFEVGTVA